MAADCLGLPLGLPWMASQMAFVMSSVIRYNQPRQASVVCSSDTAMLWALPRKVCISRDLADDLTEGLADDLADETSPMATDVLWSPSRMTSNHLASPRITSHHLPSSRITSHHLQSSRSTSHYLPSSRIISHHLPSPRITSHHLG